MILNYEEKKQEEISLKVSNVINKGGIVIAPTDTVYGMLANAFNISAIKKIYEVKGREKNKPLLILIKDVQSVKMFSDMELPIEIKKVIPGEVTFIMPLSETLKKELSYYLPDGTVALRIPNNNFILSILKKTMPLVAPSANPAGHGIIYDGDKLVELYKDKVDIIINKGEIEKKMPSTLYDCISKKVIRDGSVKITI